MNRGQVTRLMIIIGSWIALLLILVFVFVVPKFLPVRSTGSVTGVESDTLAPTLTAFLREPVQVSTATGSETMTRAEALALMFMKDDEAGAEQLTLPFITKIKANGIAKQAHIKIYADWRGKDWKLFGDTFAIESDVRKTGVTLPLPTKQTFRVEYYEVPS